MILSLLSLFQTLEAYELLSRFLINVLRNYELSSRTVESLVSVHRVNCLVFAAMQDLPAYASSLFVACQKLNNKGDPGTFVLSELASLGIQHHLSTSQLRALRRNMLHWQTQSSLPSLLPGMLSPAEDDNPSRDLLVDVTSSIRAFCLAYKRRVGDMTEIDKTLAALLSICGAPLDLVGAIMSAMMQLISDLPQEQNTLESLLSLCSAIVRMPYSSSNKPPRRDKVGELGKALESFTPTHAVFVLQLVTRNVLSIQLVLDNVCYPLLLQFSTQATSEPSASVLLDLITSLLLDSDCRDAQSWRVRAARSALYSQKSFPSVYRLGSQLSYLTHNQQDVPWRSQVRQVYERILAQPFFRSAFMKYLEGKSLTSGFPKDTSGGNVVFVWDALVSMVQPCFRTGTDLANDSQDVNSLSTASAFLLHGDMFEPFVTCLGRWFFKVLLLREQRPLTSHSADEPTSKLPRPFVEQCLRYLLEAPQNNSRAQLGMFAEHIGNDVSFEAPPPKQG